jgi:hypothetical protein
MRVELLSEEPPKGSKLEMSTVSRPHKGKLIADRRTRRTTRFIGDIYASKGHQRELEG